ncbi:unnamed protein product [Urochloa humidicola]
MAKPQVSCRVGMTLLLLLGSQRMTRNAEISTVKNAGTGTLEHLCIYKSKCTLQVY